MVVVKAVYERGGVEWAPLSAGLSALLELAVNRIAAAAKKDEFCVASPLPLRDDTVDSALDVMRRRRGRGGGADWNLNRQGQQWGQRRSSSVAAASLDTVAEFLLDAELAHGWHASAAAALAALPTSDQAGLVARGALKPLIACIGGEATREFISPR